MKATVNFAATAATPRSLLSPARSRSGAAKQHRFDKTATTTTTWLTPRAWVRALGPFDLDPCTPTAMPWKTATRMLTEEDDGLATPWPKSDFVFHNPPYGRGQERWMKKAAEHGNGISLVLNRADTKWFREWVLTHTATTALLFVEGRVKFCTADGKPSRLTCPVPAIFVAYGERAAEQLRQANVSGEIAGVFFEVLHTPNRQLAKSALASTKRQKTAGAPAKNDRFETRSGKGK